MSDCNAKWGLIEPFDIPPESLAGLSSTLCFVLGVEWAYFRDKLVSTPEPFVNVCHNANAERLAAMVKRHGRFVEYERDWCPGDWTRLEVGESIIPQDSP